MKLNSESIRAFLTNNIYTRYLFRNWAFGTEPRSVRELSPSEFLKQAVQIFCLFLGTYILFNLFVSLFNLPYLEEYSRQMREFYLQKKIAWSLYLMNSFPYSIFFLSGSLVLFQVYAAGSSYLALWVLGEKERSFARILGIAFSSGLYVLLAFFPVLLLFNIAPASIRTDVFQMVTFLSLNGILFFSGVILQCFFYVRMCRIVFDQNYGRAILTWLFPFFLFLLVIITNI